jgi:hypothetical protein
VAKCAIISPQLLLHCLYSMGGIIQHIYISVLSENLKTSKPQNLKTSKPQNLKTSLCSITTVSVSYADTFSFRSKVNTLKPRSAREKEKAAF